MNKRVVILSGLPGSYKSTYAKKLELEGAVVVSADHYFEVDGGYRFDRNLLGKAHGECLKRFIQFITEDKSVIIVDNTNLTLIDIAPYYAAARAFDYDVTVRTFFIDEEASFKRNIHSVPMKSIRDMSDRLQRRRFPPYWTLTEEKINE